MLNRPHGRTTSGKMMTRVEVDALAAEAVAGDDLDELLAPRGRPPFGSWAASVESVSVDPDLGDAVAWQAEVVGVSTSELSRKALRDDPSAGR